MYAFININHGGNILAEKFKIALMVVDTMINLYLCRPIFRNNSMSKRYFLSLLICVLSTMVSAYEFKHDGIVYSILSQKEATVAVTTGGSSQFYKGDVVIPEVTTHREREYKVVAIASKAFNRCALLSSITIPPSVVAVGDSAFYGCEGLKYLVISDGEKPLTIGCNRYSGVTAGEALFHDCPLETVYLGRELQYETGYFYGYSPFYKKAGLQLVIIGEGVREVEPRAFYGCKNLESVTIGGRVNRVENYAFHGCKSLKEVIVKEGDTPLIIGVNGQSQDLFYDTPIETLYLGRDLMRDNSGLQYVTPFESKQTLRTLTIGDAVDTIRFRQFADCHSLQSVTISGNVCKIEDEVFRGCSLLKELYLHDADSVLVVGCNRRQKSAKGEGLFHDCPLETVYLGRTLDYSTSYFSGYSPFYNAKKLKSVVVGEQVRLLGDRLFWGCEKMVSVTIGGKVEAIANYVFKECKSLTQVIFRDGILPLYVGYNKIMKSGIGHPLFSDCRLKSLYLGRTLMFNVSSFYGYSPFYKQSSMTSVTIGNGVSRLSQNLFSGCTDLSAITVPAGVEVIENNVFKDCTALRKIKFEDAGAAIYLGCNQISITERISLFQDTRLESLYLGRNLEYISTRTPFSSLPYLKTVEIGAMTLVPDELFSGCKSLESLTIGGAVEYVGNKVVQGCSNLARLEFSEGETPLTLGYNEYIPGGVGRSLFYDNPIHTLYLGRELRYPDTLPYGYSPFYRKETLSSVSIAKNVTSVGARLFYGCKSLKQLSISGNLNAVGIYAFYGCPAAN